MVKNRLINTIIQQFMKKDYLFYIKNMKNVKVVQEKILLDILEKNKSTQFGTVYHFSSVHDSASFKKAVPLTDYTAYVPYVSSMLEKENSTLTGEPVVLLEPTSGTETGTKLIPYTQSLKKEFLKAIHTWLFDLYDYYPRIKKGACYWSISPVLHRKRYQGNIPIGFEDDSDYLEGKGLLMRMLYAVPPCIKNLGSYRNFQYATAYFLLLCGHLTLVSVWNPSFFLLIIDCILKNYHTLIRDIYDGELRLPETEETGYLQPFIVQQKFRARELEYIREYGDKKLFQEIWKDLALISCWKDAYSTHHASLLQEYFPGVNIQGKGLLATEGIVSFPLVRAGGCVPAYTSHYFEFQPADSKETVSLRELEQGKTYSVILTTGGGLYRYNIKDRITVSHFYQGLPVMKFTGREKTIDTVGEKLDEGRVSAYIQSLFSMKGITPSFLLVSPEISDCSVCYSMYMETKNHLPAESLSEMEQEIDTFLLENYHYNYARKLGQIRPFKIIPVRNGRRAYMTRCIQEGMRLGNIKQVFFDQRQGWRNYFMKVTELKECR